MQILFSKLGREIKNKIESLDFFTGFKILIDYDETTPPNLLQEKIESLSKDLHPDKEGLRILQIKEDSIINANDLYGPIGFLKDLTPAQYIPGEYMIDQNQIYLYDYLLPQIREYIDNGDLHLDSDIYLEDKSILPSIDEDYGVHRTNLKEKHSNIIQKVENYVSNMVFHFRHVLNYEQSFASGNILSKYETYKSTRSWRVKFSSIKGMAVALEQSFPGLGTSVVNWLIQKLTLKTGGSITFTELISKYEGSNKKWYNFDYRKNLSYILNQYTTSDGIQMELLSHPPNSAGFSRLINFISNMDQLIKSTDLGTARGTKRAVDTNRHQILAQCICNLLKLSDSTISGFQSHFLLISKQVAVTTFEDAIQMEKLLTFCDEFFNIWIEENTDSSDEACYSPYISETRIERENFILPLEEITIENLIYHWMDWSNGKVYDFKSTFGSDSLMIKGSTPYLIMYREDSTPSDFSEYHWLHNNFNLNVKKFRLVSSSGGTRSYSIPYCVDGDDILMNIDDFMSNPEIRLAKILARWISNEEFISVNSPESALRQLIVVKEVSYPGSDTVYPVRARDSTADFAKWMFDSASRRTQLESILNVEDLTLYRNQKIAFQNIKDIFRDSIDPLLSSQITVNRQTYSLEDYYRNRVSNYRKVICYDFLVWLKEDLGFGIEYHGIKMQIYRMRKEFDARQLNRDRIPMIYICEDDTERNIILNRRGVIGYKYPLLTIEEFETMTDAWFYTYSQTEDFTFQEFIKNIHEIINTDVGIKIQEAFGYDTQGQPITSTSPGSDVVNHFWNFFTHSASPSGLFYREYKKWSEDYPNAI